MKHRTLGVSSAGLALRLRCAGLMMRRAAGGSVDAAVSLAEGFLALLYPPVCAVCRSPIPGPGVLRAGFCGPCLAAMIPPRTTPLAAAVSWAETGFPVAAAGEYHGPLQQAVQRLKYARRDDLARPLAALMGDLMVRLERERDGTWVRPGLLIPVPLHPARERRRGYNQARLLAALLSRRSGIPLAPRRALRRKRRTGSQTGRTVKQRRDKMLGAFRAGWSSGLAGKRVLLVDDVVTTGATLKACADALRAAGAGPITGLVLARTPKKKTSATS